MRWAFVLMMALSAAACGRACAEDGQWKLMSINVRCSMDSWSEAAAENNWNDPDHPRRERAIRVIRDQFPDVLGVQEARDHQVDDLKAALPEYEFYGVGRDDGGPTGEFCGVFWRADRFQCLDAGTFWLSNTPDVPGTTFDKAPDALPRIASWVKLRDESDGQQLLVVNTHWDHLPPSDVRLQSARLIRERLPQLRGDLPAVVMGDFNSTEDMAEQKELAGENDPDGLQLLDSYREIHPDRQPNERTYNEFTGRTDGSRIDFIRHTRQLEPTAAEIVQTTYDGRMPSDHFPVTATLHLKSAP